jgi:PAS domain S-box-containing protein
MVSTSPAREAAFVPLAAAQLHFALEAVPAGMLLVDETGRISFANSILERLFGYAHGELVGCAIEQLVPLRARTNHPEFRHGFFLAPQARAMGIGRDLYGLRKDGSELPVEIGLTPILTPEGRFVLSSVVDITERKRSEEQFRLALEAAPTGMLMVNDAGEITLVNAQIETLFGYSRAELMSMKIERLVPERFREHHPSFRRGFSEHPAARPMGRGRELYGLRKDGSEVPIEIGLNPLTTSSGKFILSSIVDISERKQTVQQLQERTEALAITLGEREVLLQEVHHRVKNNLQIIASLINMQMRKLEAAASREILTECKTRVDAIALIHEKLYQSRNFANVPFAEYARGLVSTIFQSSGVSLDRIVARFEIDDLTLPVAQAIPCGLILNELVTNAVKHAFPAKRSGQIIIAMRRQNAGLLCFEVADNGVGIPDFDAALERDSIGLHLVTSLTDQLEGKLQITPAPGTRIAIEFPVAR